MAPSGHQSAIDLCILPSVATGPGWSAGALRELKFTGDEFAGPGGLVVLPGGKVAVTGDKAYHGRVARSGCEWRHVLMVGQGLQNKGNPISPVTLFYTVGNAVALNSTDVGLLDDYHDYFGDTPLASPDPTIASPNSNQKTSPAEGEFPRKSLETAGPEVAAEPAPPPAPTGSDIVVGVGDNLPVQASPYQGASTKKPQAMVSLSEQ